MYHTRGGDWGQRECVEKACEGMWRHLVEAEHSAWPSLNVWKNVAGWGGGTGHWCVHQCIYFCFALAMFSRQSKDVRMSPWTWGNVCNMPQWWTHYNHTIKHWVFRAHQNEKYNMLLSKVIHDFFSSMKRIAKVRYVLAWDIPQPEVWQLM